MKKPFCEAYYSRLSIIFLLSLLIGCKKQDLISDSVTGFDLKVIMTNPAVNEPKARFDENISATLNTSLDTTKYAALLSVTCNDTLLNGGVTLADSLVSFSPEAELLPNTSYKASVFVFEKGASSPFYTYHWKFTTKGPDEFRMTLRSTRVTDFNRDGNRSMQIGKYLYSFGGWAVPEESFNDVYRSTGDLSNWEKLPNAPWHGRHVYGIGKIGDSTYIIGGDNLQSLFDVWRTTDGETWTLLVQNALQNRIFYGCTVHNGYIYVVGGAGYHDAWRSRNGADWEQVADNIPFLNGDNFSGSLTSFNGRLWMVCGGGNGYGQGVARRDVWSSSDGKEWRREKDIPGLGRQYTDVCVWDNKLWVIGGYNVWEGNVRLIWYLKPDGTWKEMPIPDEYVGRHATAVAVYNNQLTITCGSYQNNCWVIEKIK
jgi:hypothetical protein